MNDRITDYDDIINLPHHVSRRHRPMPIGMRAAQFAPFAALTGYDDVISEAARHTERELELSDSDRDRLDRIVAELRSRLNEMPRATFTYFVPDGRKEGGQYHTDAFCVKKIDEVRHLFVMTDGTKLHIRHIADIRID